MARRRKTGGLDVLITLPWWVSIALGCMVFVATRWIVPSFIASNSMLVGIAKLSQSLSGFIFVAFAIIGAISFTRSKAILWNNRGFGRTPVEQRLRRNPSISTYEPSESRHEPLMKIFDTPLADGWGASNHTTIEGKAWTLEALRTLEWKRFELLSARYYQAVGFKSETIRCGADGGIDVKLFKIDPDTPLAIVQCKAWNTYSVGVKEVRELLGVMTHEKVGRGVFITTGTYTKDALSFGASSPIQLLDGPGFLKKIQELSKDKQDALLKYAFEGDYKTPTCASCGIKMTKRDSKRGLFWGCLNYPRCKSTFVIKGC